MIDREDMGTLGFEFWRNAAQPEPIGIPAAFIHTTTGGELLIDQLAGAILKDGTFFPPPPEWRAHGGLNNIGHLTDGWHDWRGEFFRSSKQLQTDAFTLWRYDASRRSITQETTNSTGVTTQPFAGGGVYITTTKNRDGGTQFCVGAYDNERIPQDGGVIRGNLRLFDSPADPAPETLSDQTAARCIHSHATAEGESFLIRENITHNILRQTERLATEAGPYAALCLGPRITNTTKMHFACQKNGELVLWRTDLGATTPVLSVPLPEGTNMVAFIQDEPLRYLRVKDARSENAILESCSRESCIDLLSVDREPLAIGLTGPEMLVADFVADAGVRVRRVPNSKWEKP